MDITDNNDTQYYPLSCGIPSDGDLNVNLNNGSRYLYKAPNDYILWAQLSSYQHPQSNNGTAYYFYQSGGVSDAELDLESNNGTKFYYTSSFDIVQFCNDNEDEPIVGIPFALRLTGDDQLYADTTGITPIGSEWDVIKSVRNYGGGDVFATQSTASTAPRICPASANGRTGIVFGGSARLDFTDSVSTGADARTTSIVFQRISGGTVDVLFGFGAASGNQNFGAYVDGTGKIYFWGWDAQDFDTGAVAVLGATHTLTFRYSGTELETYLDGALVDSRAKVLNTGVNPGAIGINWHTPVNNFHGAIFAYTHCTSALSDDELTILHSYLMGRFGSGIPSTPNRLRANSNYIQARTITAFTDGTGELYQKPSPADGNYTYLWLADSWIAFQGDPARVPATVLEGMIRHAYAARDGDGNIPIAVSPAGVGALYTSGCLASPERQQPDAMWALIGLHRTLYSKAGDLAPFTAQRAVLEAQMALIPRSDVYVNVVRSPNGWMPFGFEDGLLSSGKNLFGTLLHRQALVDIAALLTAAGDSTGAMAATADAVGIASALQNTSGPLWDAGAGMFLASDENNNQISVIGSAFAVWSGAASPAQSDAISNYLSSNFATLFDANGFVRQSPVNWSHSVGGQCGRGAGNYDDGFWNHGHLWVLSTLARVNIDQARIIADRCAVSMPRDNWLECYGATANGYVEFSTGANPVAAWAASNY